MYGFDFLFSPSLLGTQTQQRHPDAREGGLTLAVNLVSGTLFSHRVGCGRRLGYSSCPDQTVGVGGCMYVCE